MPPSNHFALDETIELACAPVVPGNDLLMRANRKVSRRKHHLPCEKPLRMLLLHFPKQPAADSSRGPHGGVDEGAGCESVTEQLDPRVRNIITHRHFLELSSRRIGRCP